MAGQCSRAKQCERPSRPERALDLRWLTTEERDRIREAASKRGLSMVDLEVGIVRRYLKGIHVSMHLVAPEDLKEKVERTHTLYPMACPLYRTLHNAIRLTSSVELVCASAS